MTFESEFIRHRRAAALSAMVMRRWWTPHMNSSVIARLLSADGDQRKVSKHDVFIIKSSFKEKAAAGPLGRRYIGQIFRFRFLCGDKCLVRNNRQINKALSHRHAPIPTSAGKRQILPTIKTLKTCRCFFSSADCRPMKRLDASCFSFLRTDDFC